MKRVATTYIQVRSCGCEASEGSGLSLVCALYDNNFNLVPSGSGALRVENPNQLESLITDEINVTKDGFMHMYVSNGSADKGLYFDNSCGERSRTILVTMLDGSTRQINHYGSSCACAPDIADGLRIAGLDGYSHDYKNMYTGKELQTEEFQPFISTGLEMPAPSGHAIHHTHASRQTCVTISGYDFIRACPLSAVLMRPLCLVHARFGACPERSRRDPQLGRPALSVVEVWFTPDPATARESVWTEQFHNPYLAMGNNPVGYIDPDGRFVFFMPHVNAGRGSFDIGFTIGVGIPGVKSAQLTLGHTFQQGGPDNSYASLSGTLGGVTGYVGYGTQTGTTAGVGFGFSPYMGGFNTNLTSVGVNWSQNYGVSANAFGATIGNGHIGFNPSVGYSYGWGWETGGSDGSPFNDNNLLACADCPVGYIDLDEFVVRGKLNPRQQFKQWQRDRASWGNNWYYMQYGRKESFFPSAGEIATSLQVASHNIHMAAHRTDLFVKHAGNEILSSPTFMLEMASGIVLDILSPVQLLPIFLPGFETIIDSRMGPPHEPRLLSSGKP